MAGNRSDSVNDLIKTLRVQVAGAAPEAIELELENTLREFCTKTNVWIAELEQPINLDSTVYSITAYDNDSEVTAVLAVQVDGRPVSGWSGYYQKPDNVGGAFEVNPDQLIQDTINTISLGVGQFSASSQTLGVTVALRPRRGTVNVPDMIGYGFFDVILDGAVSRLLQHPNRPYENLTAGRQRHRSYMAGLTRARVTTKSRFSQMAAPWAYPQAAPGRRYR